MDDSAEVGESGHEIRDDAKAGRFELLVGGKLVALLQYQVKTPSVYALIHAETESGYEGRGFAGELVTGVLDRLRAKGATIRPHCPYVSAYLHKHPEYLDLVAREDRERFDLPRKLAARMLAAPLAPEPLEGVAP